MVILWVCSGASDELKTGAARIFSLCVKVVEVSDIHNEDFMLKNEEFQHN